MGSTRALSTPSPSPEVVADTHDSDTIISDGPGNPALTPRGKRKRGALREDELQAFISITEVVRDIAQAIGDNKPIDTP
jgi:hypothetical protein